MPEIAEVLQSSSSSSDKGSAGKGERVGIVASSCCQGPSAYCSLVYLLLCVRMPAGVG
jgi:hypothetical protein